VRAVVAFEDRQLAVAGAQLHVRSGGTAGSLPTLVLEAGGGSLLSTWEHLERELAAHTRLLSYERAGIGQSAGPVAGVRPPAVAERLDALLEATRTTAPVVLAGHSLGGLYMRYFAATRPERVAGLVLLDTTPEDLPFPRFFSVKPTLMLWLMHGLARIGLLQRLVARRSTGTVSQRSADDAVAALAHARHVRAVLAEIRALPAVQADVAATPPTRVVPILTVSAGAPGPGVPREKMEAFQRSHARLAASGAAPHNRHVVVAGATHMSMLTDPAHAATVSRHLLEFLRGCVAR
jgi:pimeloyl-ACP methyl ester carboxylesterase